MIITVKKSAKFVVTLIFALGIGLFAPAVAEASSQPGVIYDPAIVMREEQEKTGPGAAAADEGQDGTGGGSGTAGEETAADGGSAAEEATSGGDSAAEEAQEDTTSGEEFVSEDTQDDSADNGEALSDETGNDESTESDVQADLEEAARLSSLEMPNTVVRVGDSSAAFINGRQIDLDKPSLALTYDDGPQTTVGNRIMDIMAAYGQKCTFFMVGDRVAARASEVQRMVAEGHEIANHTYNHVYLNKVSASEIVNQVSSCNTVLAQTTGVTPVLMRLPGGIKNDTVLANVNMPIILWNIDTLDWKTRNAQSTVNAVMGSAKAGDIILMHELYEATADATATIVPALVEQGFQLLTVSELAAVRGVTLNPGQIYYSF